MLAFRAKQIIRNERMLRGLPAEPEFPEMEALGQWRDEMLRSGAWITLRDAAKVEMLRRRWCRVVLRSRRLNFEPERGSWLVMHAGTYDHGAMFMQQHGGRSLEFEVSMSTKQLVVGQNVSIDSLTFTFD